MAVVSFVNNAHNNRVVTLPEHEQILSPLGLSGFLNFNGSPPFFADATGLKVKLRAGVSGTIRGTRFNNPTDLEVPIPPNTSGNPRSDLVVMRLRREESTTGAGDQYTISPVVREGVPGENPVTPIAVRNDTIDGTGVWDIPGCKVSVVNGATTIQPSECVNQAFWVTGSGYVGYDTAFPPVTPGVLFKTVDTNITWIGSTSGKWHRLYDYSDWFEVTTGANKAGWDFRNFAVARDGNMVVMSMYLLRTGGAVSSAANQYFGPIPERFRPTRTVYGVWHCSGGDFTSHIAALPDGQILLAANGVNSIPTNSQVLANLTWITAA